MAELNPHITPTGEINPDRSRGSIPDTSGAELVQDASQLFQAGVSAADKQIRRQMYDDVSSEVSDIRDDVINRLGGPVQADTGQAAVGAYSNRVSALNQARQAGTLSESHYWAMLDVTTRRLRQKYPGYRKEIDEVIRNVAGADPANRLVHELMRQKTAGRSSEEAQHQYWLHQATELGLPIAISYQQKALQGAAPSTLDLQSAVAVAKQDLAQRTANALMLTQRKAAGEEVRADAYRQAVSNIYKQIGADWTGIAGSIANFNQQIEAARNGKVPPKQLLDLQNLFVNTIQKRVMNVVNNTLDMPSAEGGLSYGAMIGDATKVKQIRDMFKDMIDNMGAQISPNGDWSLFTRYKTELEAITRDATNSILNDPDVGKAVAGMKGLQDLFGQQTYQRILNLRIPGAPANAATVEARLARGLEKLFLQDSSVSKELSDIRSNPSTAPNAGILTKALIDKTTSVIADPDANVASIEKAATALFDTSKGDFFKDYTQSGKNNAAQLYKTVIGNSDLHRNMQKIKETNRPLFDKYSRWVVDNFATSLENEANLLTQFTQSSNDDFANLRFDVNTNRFFLIDPDNKYTAEKKSIENINSAIAGFTNFLAATPGRNPEDILDSIATQIDGLRLNTSQTPQHGLWKRIKTYMSRFIDEVTYSGAGPEFSQGPMSPEGGQPADYSSLLNAIGGTYAPARSDLAGGTAGGNAYNIVQDASGKTVSDRNVSGKSIADVISSSDDFPGEKYGRYGLTADAVKESIDYLKDPGITLNTKFTRQVQDRLIVGLLQKLGLESVFLNDTSTGTRERMARIIARQFPGVDTKAIDDALANIGSQYGRYGAPR